MRVAKPIMLTLPTKVVEKVGNVRNRENYLYLVHYLLLQPLYNKRIDEDYKGFAPINKEKLKSVISCNIDTCIKFLLNDEIIERDFYKVGKKPYYYRVNPDLINGSYTNIALTDSEKIFDKITKQQRNKKANYNRLEPHLKEMQKHLMQIQYDYKGALKWTKNNATGEKKASYLIAINQIQDKRFRYFKRNKTNNRLDTNFTNLKSGLRPFIKGDFIQIDLKNSQPFFLSIFLSNLMDKLTGISGNLIHSDRELLRTIPICLGFSVYDMVKAFGLQQIRELSKIHQNGNFPEMMKFRNTTLSGNFYNDFIDLYGNGITRKEVKDLMFKVLFSRNVVYKDYKRFVPYEDEKKVFTEVFPIVYKMVEVLKEKEHNQLAIMLQKMESRIFIDMIAKELVNSGIIPLTIHDSVIIPSNKQDEALKIMKQIFYDEVGVIPAFSVEKLNIN